MHVGLGAGVLPAPPPLAQIHTKRIRQILGAELTRLGHKGTDVRSLSLAPQGRQPCRGSFARARFRKGSWVVVRSVEHHDPSASEPPEGKEQSHVGPLANKLDAFRTVITADSSDTTWQLHPKTQAQQAIHNHRSCNGRVPELQRTNPSGPS